MRARATVTLVACGLLALTFRAAQAGECRQGPEAATAHCKTRWFTVLSNLSGTEANISFHQVKSVAAVLPRCVVRIIIYPSEHRYVRRNVWRLWTSRTVALTQVLTGASSSSALCRCSSRHPRQLPRYAPRRPLREATRVVLRTGRKLWRSKYPLPRNESRLLAGYYLCDKNVRVGKPRNKKELTEQVAHYRRVKGVGIGHSWNGYQFCSGNTSDAINIVTTEIASTLEA